MSVVKQVFSRLLQMLIVSLLHVVIFVCFVIMAQNIEEQCLRGIIKDILDESYDSELTAWHWI
jgi:hypothetical protein